MTRQIILVEIGAGMALDGVLPSVVKGDPYVAVVAARGGAVPYSYTITDGASTLAAAGVTLDRNTGEFSAAAVDSDAALPVTVRATDITGAFVERRFVIAVAAPAAAPPPPAGPAVLLGLGAAMGAGGSGSGDAIPYVADTGVRIEGALQFDAVQVYTPDAATDFGGQSWVGYAATSDTTLAGTAFDAYDANGNGPYSLTWKLVSDFIKTPIASGTNVPLTPTTDGLGGSMINTNDLLAALGYSGYDNSGLLIVATLRDTTSGATWEATWALDTYF